MPVIFILVGMLILGCSVSESDRLEHDRAVFRKNIHEIRLIGRTIKGENITNIGRIITNMCIDGDISHEIHRSFEESTREWE